MRWAEWQSKKPEELVAMEEALLDALDAAEAPEELLLFWEPPIPFVVLGYFNRVGTEVNAEACARDGVPVLRRVSGGGAVLQMPGSVSYALFLRLDRRPELSAIDAANRLILARNADAVNALLDKSSPAAGPKGLTDLCLGEKKCSGNAQRRKRRTILFHGTFLLKPNFEAVESYLKMPSLEPDYRRNRPHRDFLTHLPVSADALKTALRKSWSADSPYVYPLPVDSALDLAQTRYTNPTWSNKY
jgi:lipoate---protein ligase